MIFQRLHSRDVNTGTGIGPALCRKIVEFHGGRIWLDTDATPGATFRWTLPKHASSTTDAELTADVGAMIGTSKRRRPAEGLLPPTASRRRSSNTPPCVPCSSGRAQHAAHATTASPAGSVGPSRPAGFLLSRQWSEVEGAGERRRFLLASVGGVGGGGFQTVGAGQGQPQVPGVEPFHPPQRGGEHGGELGHPQRPAGRRQRAGFHPERAGLEWHHYLRRSWRRRVPTPPKTTVSPYSGTGCKPFNPRIVVSGVRSCRRTASWCCSTARPIATTGTSPKAIGSTSTERSTAT